MEHHSCDITLPMSVDEERKRLLDLRHSANSNTDSATRTAVATFGKYLEQRGNTVANVVEDSRVLDAELELFFISLKKSNGDKMKVNSLNSIRYGLNRHIRHITSEHFDITNNAMFPKSCQIVKGIKKDLKSIGKGDTTPHDNIPPEDLKKIISTLDVSDPQQLQWLTFVFIQLYCCRRGQQHWEKMGPNTFAIAEDVTGRKYVYQRCDEIHSSQGRMMYQSVDKTKCPVAVFEAYLSKLPDDAQRLWLYPKTTWSGEEVTWFSHKPLGRNAIAGMMSDICGYVGTKRYTNHCLRMASGTVLGEDFFENDINADSEHGSFSSLGMYERTGEEEIVGDVASANCTSTSPACVEAPEELDECKIELPVSTSMSSWGEINVVSSDGVSRSMVFEAPPEKKMKIEADGDANRVTITFG